MTDSYCHYQPLEPFYASDRLVHIMTIRVQTGRKQESGTPNSGNIEAAGGLPRDYTMSQSLFSSEQSLDNQLSQSSINDEIRRLEQRIHRMQLTPDQDTASIVALSRQLRERLMVLNWSRGHRSDQEV